MQVPNATASPMPAPKKPDDPSRIHEAAQQFEGFLISQILKTMSSSGSFLGTDEDQAGSTAVDMAEEQFAKALSSGGGLGLAKLVEAGLATAKTEHMLAGRRGVDVTRIRITDAGRRALAAGP